MDTFIEEPSKCCDYFLKLSGFPNLSGKVFLMTLNSPNLINQQVFARAMQIKQFDLFFSFVKV